MKLQKPYSDNNMIYDFKNHRYILTQEYVLEQMNIDLTEVLNTSANADIANVVSRLLDRISRILYRFIYRLVALRYKTEKLLAMDADIRDNIMRAMDEQLLYMLQNGDLTAYAGLDVQSGTSISKEEMRGRELAPMAYDEVMEMGFSALIPQERDIKPKYEEEGY